MSEPTEKLLPCAHCDCVAILHETENRRSERKYRMNRNPKQPEETPEQMETRERIMSQFPCLPLRTSVTHSVAEEALKVKDTLIAEMLETLAHIADRLSDPPLACRSPEERLEELLGWIDVEILPMCGQVIAKAKGETNV